MKAADAVGIGVEVINLDLKFFRIGPEVVAFAECEKFRVNPVDEHRHDLPAKRILVLCSQDGPDPTGMIGLILPDDATRTIGRTIIMNQYLNKEFRLLGEETVERTCNELGMVEGDTANRQSRCSAQGAGGFRKYQRRVGGRVSHGSVERRGGFASQARVCRITCTTRAMSARPTFCPVGKVSTRDAISSATGRRGNPSGRERYGSR